MSKPKKTDAARGAKPGRQSKPRTMRDQSARDAAKVAKLTAKADEKPAALTDEQLWAKLGEALDAVDAHMETRPRGYGDTMWSGYGYGPFSTLRSNVRQLLNVLDERLRGTFKNGRVTVDYEKPSAEEIAAARFRLPLGEVGWARPCGFVLWVGDIPVGVEWPGIFSDRGHVFALDARQLWLDANGRRETYLSRIPPEPRTMPQLMRGKLAAMVTDYSFALHSLTPEAAAAAAAFLALPEHGWWREQLAAGPIMPLPLPKHLRPVQPRLFA